MAPRDKTRPTARATQRPGTESHRTSDKSRPTQQRKRPKAPRIPLPRDEEAYAELPERWDGLY